MAERTPEGIRRRGPDAWEIKYYVPGRGPKTETVHGTLQDAVKERSKRLSDLAKGKFVLPSRLSMSAFLAEWLRVKEATLPEYSSTLVHLRVTVKRWQLAIGHIRLQRLEARDLNATVEDMLRTLSPKTVQMRLSWLRTALDWAVDLELVGRNVAKSASMPKVQRREMAYWTLPQLSRFLAIAGRYGVHGRMLAAGACTGWRTESEWGGMPTSGVDLKRKTAAITQVLRGPKPKAKKGKADGWILEPAGNSKSKRRLVHLNDLAMPFLEAQDAWLREQYEINGLGWNAHRLFFVNEWGRPVSAQTLRKDFAKMTAEAGLPRIRVHDLRHSYATIMLSLGVHPKVVQEALGHSTIQQTIDTYSHLIPGLEEAAGEVFAAAVQAEMGGKKAGA